MTSMLLEEDAKEDAPPRSKSNPFQDVPHDKKATVFKQGFLQRKAHADIDGKRSKLDLYISTKSVQLKNKTKKTFRYSWLKHTGII